MAIFTTDLKPNASWQDLWLAMGGLQIKKVVKIDCSEAYFHYFFAFDIRPPPPVTDLR